MPIDYVLAPFGRGSLFAKTLNRILGSPPCPSGPKLSTRYRTT